MAAICLVYRTTEHKTKFNLCCLLTPPPPPMFPPPSALWEQYSPVSLLPWLVMWCLWVFPLKSTMVMWLGEVPSRSRCSDAEAKGMQERQAPDTDQGRAQFQQKSGKNNHLGIIFHLCNHECFWRFLKRAMCCKWFSSPYYDQKCMKTAYVFEDGIIRSLKIVNGCFSFYQ